MNWRQAQKNTGRMRVVLTELSRRAADSDGPPLQSSWTPNIGKMPMPPGVGFQPMIQTIQKHRVRHWNRPTDNMGFCVGTAFDWLISPHNPPCLSGATRMIPGAFQISRTAMEPSAGRHPRSGTDVQFPVGGSFGGKISAGRVFLSGRSRRKSFFVSLRGMSSMK